MDLLLRPLSRRNGAPVSEVDEQHLDADELNSYVANALPPAARARYTAHVADCPNCRKLVVQLSAAQGPVVVQQSTNVVAPWALKSFLASLFSPMVLRYAVPALGLIVVAAVAIFVSRSGPQSSSISQVKSPDENGRVAVTKSEPEALTSAERAYGDTNSADTSANKQIARRAEVAQEGAAVAPVTKEAAKDGSIAAAKEVPANANQPADQTGAATGNAAAAPPAPKVTVLQSEPPQVTTDLSKQKKEEAAEKRDTAASVEAKAREGEPIKNEYQKPDAVTVKPGTTTRKDMQIQEARRTAEPAAGAGTAGLARMRPQKQPGTFASETRSVAGRRFRKTSSGWADTAYDSSKAYTNVSRGSEQYRALVADEPSIRTIAEQLDGEVYVVWKGRTYRIR